MSRNVSVYPEGVQRGRLTEVVALFLCRRVAYGGSLATDGEKLYSYMVTIGEWDGKAVRLPESHRFYSRTTSRHRNMLRDMATARGIELVE
jgi:hypothetical protein